ncbi:MAG: hypothetical protein L7S41_04245 [Candidatus Thalassarchaeaceae archaeon]|nr:hypothetical protein [Candidatus Thalassarchaeaceae archaeon]
MLTSAQQEPELGNWQLGIKYIGDNDATAFVISENGERAIEFYVHNTEMFEVEVSFEYELPFEGSADGPETEKIQAGDNETFTLNIENIDVFNFDANSKEEMKITASLVTRAGIAVLIPENQESTGDLEIPTVHSISVDLAEPAGAMNAGTDMVLRVTVTNNGNIKDKVGEIDLSDNCPLMTLDNGLDKLLVTDLEKGQSSNADLKITASESHPRKNCKLEITVHSNGAMNSGKSKISEDETSITVEPPLTKPVDNQDSNDDEESVTQVVDSSLPTSGISVILFSSFMALFYISRNKKKNN